MGRTAHKPKGGLIDGKYIMIQVTKVRAVRNDYLHIAFVKTDWRVVELSEEGEGIPEACGKYDRTNPSEYLDGRR